MRQAGFSLIELAIVLVGLGLLLGGMLRPLAAQLELRRIQETERELARVEDALIAHAAVNGNRLPCPDLDGDGIEDIADTLPMPCAGAEGIVPWVTLGVGRRDGWGRVLRYRADDAFTALTGVPSPPATRSGLALTAVEDGSRLTVGDPHAPVAIAYSCGPNGIPDGANRDGAADGCTGASEPDEAYEVGVAGAQFDDVVAWVSKNVLLARLIQAGTWP